MWRRRWQRAAARSSGTLNGVGAGKHAPAGLLRHSAAWMTPLTYTHTPTFSPYLSSFQPDSRLRRFKLACFRRAVNAQELTWKNPQRESLCPPKLFQFTSFSLTGVLEEWDQYIRPRWRHTYTHTVNVFYYSLPNSCCQDDDGDADDGSVTGFSQSHK